MKPSFIILSVLAVLAVIGAGITLVLNSPGAETEVSADTSDAKIQAPNADLQRIVTTDGALTEMVYALGEGDQVIAADASAYWPISVKKKPNIGYVRNLSAEGILSVKPGLLINSTKAGPPNVIQQLRASGTPMVDVTDEHADDMFKNIPAQLRQVGKILKAEAKANELAAAVEADLKMAREMGQKKGQQETVLFIFNHSGRFTVGGKDTHAHDMIELVGLKNAAEGVSKWKPLSPESLLTLNPDWVIIADSGKLNREAALKALSDNGWEKTKAGQKQRLVMVNSIKFLGKGPRVGVAALELIKAIYPDEEVPSSLSAPWFEKVEREESR